MPLDLELVENLPTYVKMSVLGMRGPVKITIDYVQSGLSPDKLTIFTSLSNKKPDKTNYDWMRAGNPTNLSVSSLADRYCNWFEEEFVYLSLTTSHKYLRITVTAVLPNNQTKHDPSHCMVVKKDILPGPPESYGRKYQ